MSDGMYPGPLLEVLTEQAVTGSPRFAAISARHTMPPDAAAAAADSIAAGVGPLAGIPGVPGADGVRRLTDDELLGTMSAAQRLQNRAEWLELSVLAEFTRRYAEQEAAVAKRDPIGQRAGEFANEKVAPCSAGPPPPARPPASVRSTLRPPVTSSRPLPATRRLAGA